MIQAVSPKFSFKYASAKIDIYHADKNQGLPYHSHIYSHAVACCSGSCILRLRNKVVIIDKNSQPVNLPANVYHEIEAIEDGSVFVNIFEESKY